jgi:Rrf2 family iron-sulfur cluster assembly transcriptional regulator
VELLRRNTDYALRAMAHLARLDAGTVASAGVVSGAEGVPEPLLRKLLQRLSRAGLVASVRGIRGGFRLARPAGSITVLDVVETIQGKLAVNRCFLGAKRCPNQGGCALSRKLAGVQDHLKELFAGLSLADLAGESRLHQPCNERIGPESRRRRSGRGSGAAVCSLVRRSRGGPP